MILEKIPVTMAEVKEVVVKLEERQALKDYMKKFTKLSKDKAEKLIEEVKALKNLKIKEENLVKLADFLPRDAEDLNKVFTEVNLNEEEINAILEITKKY